MKIKLKQILANSQKQRIIDTSRVASAVLLPLFKSQEDYHILFIKRTDTVKEHKGQISFPGGMREEKETLWDTALRETFEEVGIGNGQVEQLGRFHDYISITEYRVTPFVGFIRSPFETKRQAMEVAEILHVPFSVFLDPTKRRVEWNKHPGREPDVYFYSHENHEIWGLTARIIKDFFETLNLKS